MTSPPWTNPRRNGASPVVERHRESVQQSQVAPRDRTDHPRSEMAARLEVVRLSAVASRPVGWIWNRYFPSGKLVALDGLPGQGKSTIALDIIARLSRGSAMPDGSPGLDHAADSLILSYEDDPADTLRPRLEAVGADLDRIGIIAGVSYNGDSELLPPSLPKDLEVLDCELASRPEVRFILIDPFAAAISADVDMHRDQDVRRPLARLARLARERNTCVVIIRHVRKSHGGNAIYAGGGSVGISGQARVVMVVEQDPEDPTSAVLAVAKSNVAEIPPALTFRKLLATVPAANGDVIRTSRLEWTGTANVSADELLQARGDGGDQKDAADFLREILANGKVERTQVVRAGTAAGILERTLDRTAKRIGVVKKSEGFSADKRAYWSLASTTIPATNDHSRQFSPTSGIGGNEAGGGNGELAEPLAEQLL
jgi:hypothetical protein